MNKSPKYRHLFGEDDTSPCLKNTTNGVHLRTPGDWQRPKEILRVRCCMVLPVMGKEEGQPKSNINGERELMGFHFIKEKYLIHIKCHLFCYSRLRVVTVGQPHKRKLHKSLTRMLKRPTWRHAEFFGTSYKNRFESYFSLLLFSKIPEWYQRNNTCKWRFMVLKEVYHEICFHRFWDSFLTKKWSIWNTVK